MADDIKSKPPRTRGKLRIGDDWNAISIIALSQQSPLKAIAEFVENSLDARAKNVVITRGREHGQFYLRITDDGDGVPTNALGVPDFHYVATHIGDSLKRRLKGEARAGVQGEFGIGLLSFWTLGEELIMTSTGQNEQAYEMRMRKNDSRYTVSLRHKLFAERGTELVIKPLLPGLRQLSGEKIQWYLASELRDRIRHTGAHIRVVDRAARTQYEVVPREFMGQLLHALPAAPTPHGEVYLELYLTEPSPENSVGLYRHGTRVMENLVVLDAFSRPPWNSGALQGIVDAPFLNLTPGTRTGVLQDERFAALCQSLAPVEEKLTQAIEEQRRAAEEHTSHQILRSIHRAFREALLTLPAEEYDWFEIPSGKNGMKTNQQQTGLPRPMEVTPAAPERKEFFDFAGPLHSVVISPAACTVPVNTVRNLRAVPRDRARRQVEQNLVFNWTLAEGTGLLDNGDKEIAMFRAPSEPGLARIHLQVRQGEITCETDALLTVTDELVTTPPKEAGSRPGLPAYTFERAAGRLWRSRYDSERNLIIVNNAHRDFVFASRHSALKLRYLCRLYVKEMVQKNFPGLSTDRLLERMVELSLYTEEHLK